MPLRIVGNSRRYTWHQELGFSRASYFPRIRASLMAAIAIAAANAAFVDEDYEAAVGNYGAALSAEPQNDEAYSKRAAALLKLKRYTDAAADATANARASGSPAFSSSSFSVSSFALAFRAFSRFASFSFTGYFTGGAWS